METLETIKEGFILVFKILMSFPKEFNIALGVIILSILTFVTFISFIFEKDDKKKENKNKKNKDKNKNKNNENTKVYKEPTINELPSFSFYENEIIIDENQKIDRLYGNKKGIYLIFEYKKLKGNLIGDKYDEFLFIKKNKILNPLNEKHSYIKRFSINYHIPEEYIKLVFIMPKIKEINVDNTLFFKSDNELEAFIEKENDLIDEELLFNYSERFSRRK